MASFDAHELALPSSSGDRVARNTMFLVVSKILATPITIFNQALLARYLGAEDFGFLYVAQAYASFGTLLITWGQATTVPSATAQDRSRAPELLGSALLLRASVALVVSAAFAVGCLIAMKASKFRMILAFVFAQATIAAVTGAWQDMVRGFERTDVDALLQVLGPFLGLVCGFVILVLGGRIPSLMICGIALNLLTVQVVRRSLAHSGVRTMTWSRKAFVTLAADGWPFLFYGFALTLQPAIDAAFLARFAPGEVVGWHAVAVKVVGVSIFPAGALLSSLYPVLCRLHAQDRDEYRRQIAGAVRAATLLVVPIALGCALFPDIAIRLFSRASYGAARDNLRVLSVFVFALYFSMPLGAALLAAGRQRIWSLVQCLCVVLSLCLDPLLVPWFQRHMGNGGLGICVSVVVSECAMVAAAIWLTPSGVFGRDVLRSLGLACVGGVAMVAVAHFFSGMTQLLVAPLSLLCYGVCLFATGGLSRSDFAVIGRIVSRKFAR